MKKFRKKIFTARFFFNDLGYFLRNTADIIEANRNKKIPGSLKEKIMLVTAAVNGCTYCIWLHGNLAVASGVSNDEIKKLLSFQFNADTSDEELMALLYAQHFAETSRNPDQGMTQKLVDFYGDQTAKHIILLLRLVYFGNLMGNTTDAFFSRCKGIPAENSNVVFEILFFLLTFWFMIPWMVMSKNK
ncbi:MAG: carboxymuconolactone decarboxylase family protein [Bacteroidales bacterium]|nr:carboxymuconolactone decarboxylase family protein [Bacteroidales bacterium]